MAIELQPKNHLAMVVMFTVIAWTGVFLRFWVTRKLPRVWPSWRLAADIFVVIGPTTMSVHFLATVWIIAKGLSLANDPTAGPPFGVTPALTVTCLKIYFTSRLAYPIAIHAVKMSFVATYLEVGRHLRTPARVLLYFTTGLIISSLLFNIFITIFWCHPIQSTWQAKPGEYDLCTPWHNTPQVVAIAVLNIITDTLIMVIGVMILQNLKLRKNEVGAVFFVLMIGGLTIAFAIVRISLMVQYNRNLNGNPSGFGLNDYSAIFSEIESIAAIVASVLPAFRVLFRRSERNNTPRHIDSSGRTGPFSYLSKLSGRKGTLVSSTDECVVGKFHDSSRAGSHVELRRYDIAVEYDITVESRSIEHNST